MARRPDGAPSTGDPKGARARAERGDGGPDRRARDAPRGWEAKASRASPRDGCRQANGPAALGARVRRKDRGQSQAHRDVRSGNAKTFARAVREPLERTGRSRISSFSRLSQWAAEFFGGSFIALSGGMGKLVCPCLLQVLRPRVRPCGLTHATQRRGSDGASPSQFRGDFSGLTSGWSKIQSCDHLEIPDEGDSLYSDWH